jgi:alpha-galactosidase
MKALAAYVHSKGLKLGIYSSPGAQTCAHFEGSLGHEEQDAQTYADWGIDYLKYDLCSYRQNMKDQAPNDVAAQNKMMRDAYEKMHQAILKTGRPMVYSLCQYGWDAPWAWAPSVGGNLWRTTGDINATWDKMTLIGREQAGLARFAGPGHWNDPDMLEVGNGRLSVSDGRTQMSLWAILAAPLLAGNDLTKMSAETREILCNREVIAIDQDAAGKQGDRIAIEGPLEVWMRPLADGAKAVGLFNHGRSGMKMHVNFADAGLRGSVAVREVWEHKDLGAMQHSFETFVPKHAVVLLVLKPARD